MKLLDFDEIQLVFPAIVVHETNKHLEEQLAEVGNKDSNRFIGRYIWNEWI